MNEPCQHPILQYFAPQSLDATLSSATFTDVEAGATLACSGDLLLLLRGAMTLSAGGDAKSRHNWCVVGAPAVLGWPVLTHVVECEALALERCRVLRIPQASVEVAVRESSALTHALFAEQSALFELCLDQYRQRTVNSVEQRLANVIWAHLDLFGLPARSGLLIRVPLPLEHLAQSLGVTERTITRAIEKWRSLGIITRRGRKLVVSDVYQLAEKVVRSSLLGVHRCGERHRHPGDELRSLAANGVSLKQQSKNAA